MGTDEAIRELLAAKHDPNVVGVDVRLRKEDDEGRIALKTVVHKFVWADDLPENTTDDDIARLKEKLELLEKIRKLQEIMEKFNEEHPDFVPIRYPDVGQYTPWPLYPWQGPFYCNTGTCDGTKIDWRYTGSDGNSLW